MKIETYNQLIKYISDNQLKPVQAIKLIEKCLLVFFTKDYEAIEELIKDLNRFWYKWQYITEKPFFIDAED